MSGAVGRGTHLVRRGRGFASGTGLVARLAAPSLRRVLDAVDRGLEAGSLEGHLPDGSVRLLGGRGEGPHAVVEVRSWRALIRLATGGSVGWYQAWAAGEWWSADPVPLFDLFMRNGVTLADAARAKGPWRHLNRLVHWLRRNTPRRARRNIAEHYDLGNDFYAAWLDPTMSYSSAQFDGSDTLEAAQRAKLANIADRLALPNGARVLEIGCGWGSQARELAERGYAVTAISLSDQQLDWARGRVPGVDFRHQDYRAVTERFDGVVSVEMVEAVGQRYWPAFLDACRDRLRPGGRAVLQFIAIDDRLFDAYAASADFIQAYIFPGGCLLSEGRFRELAAARGLRWTDETRFGLDYAETLRQWRERFDRAVEEGRLPSGFDAEFVDLWRYYLRYCEGGFRGGGIWVAQVTLVRE